MILRLSRVLPPTLTLPLQGGGNQKRRGVILFAVLIVVAVLMLVGYQFLNLMSVELEAAVATNKVAQARRLADSGLHYAAYMLAYPGSAGLNNDGSLVVSPMLAYDNADLFHQRPITDPMGNVLGYFSLVSPREATDPLAASQGFRFGVEDETGKINLNAVLKIDKQGTKIKEVLGQLPNLSPDSAGALLNWMRSPSAQDGSGDSLYYAGLGYSQKYGPYESMEELLLVRGITPRLLLGNDRNRNGLLEPEENDASGILDPGLSAYLTVYSRELNLTAYGQPRTFINSTDLSSTYSTLSGVLGSELAGFIVLARQNGLLDRSVRFGTRNNPPPNETIEGGPKESDLKFDAVASDQLKKINSLWDLVDGRVLVTVPGQRGQQSRRVLYNSPLKKSDASTLAQVLPVLLDNVTTTNALELPARINILSAPQELLASLPGITQAEIEKIVNYRNAAADPNQSTAYSTLAWLVTQAEFDPTLITQIEPFITTRAQVFRTQVVGYHELNGPAVRLEAVIDTNAGRPRILYWRELSDLGRGFNFNQGTSTVVP